MYLDVRTMVIILTLGALLSSGGMALIGRRFADKVNGPLRFSLALLLFVFGLGLLGLRSFIPDFLSTVVANVLLIYAVGMFYQAIRRFQAVDYNNKFLYAVTAAVALAQFYFTYVDFNFLIRTIVISIAVSVLLLHSAQALLFRQPKPMPTSHWLTASGFILVALINLGRAAYETIPGNALESYFMPAPVQDVTFLGFFIGMMTVLFGFVLMIYDKMNLSLELLATHDSLTGMYNRRTILELLKVASAGSRRNQTSLTVMMIDLDDFKSVNDTHGHMEGDGVLREVAATLKAGLREQDAIGRYGGEEFLAVLPNTDEAGAWTLAERLRAAVEKASLQAGGQKISLTASIGVASSLHVPNSGDLLLRRADKALMGAKRKGRDQVLMAQ